MRRMIIAGLLLLAVAVGCESRVRDRKLQDGTKYFGERTLKDGSQKIARVELPNGDKLFDATNLPDGTQKAVRAERADGRTGFDETILPDGTVKIARTERPDGSKVFDVTTFPNGTVKIARVEFPNGGKSFDSTRLPDHTIKIARSELSDGSKEFDDTTFPDQTRKIARTEFPDGRKEFNVTILPDGTKELPSRELPPQQIHTYRAEELAAMSANNLARFDRDFFNKSLRVVGRVDEIESDGSVHFWLHNFENNHTSIEIENPPSSRLTLEVNNGETTAVTGYYAGVDPRFAAPRLVIIAQRIEHP
jgi:hypothetical protein